MSYYHKLITAAETEFEKNPIQINQTRWFNLFKDGSQWMKYQLNELEVGDTLKVIPSHLNTLGTLKYLICILPSCVLAIIFSSNSLLLLFPLLVLLFYILEVHLVFLIPLVLQGEKSPITKGVRMVYKFGYLKALYTTIRIAFYMISGLVRFNNPFRKWHIGCLAVLIWYKHEI